METKILVLTISLGHMSHRIHYLLRFLEKRKINVKVFDIGFRHETQTVFEFFKNILSFPSKALTSSKSTISFPSLPVLGNNLGNFQVFTHFMYPFLEFILAKIISKPLDYDVIVATDPASAFVASAVMKSKTIFVYEDEDYFEDLQSGKTRSAFISILEKMALKRADLVVSVSEPLLRRARMVNSKCILVPNGTDLASFPRPHDTHREPFMVYAGSVVDWAGLDLVIETFALLKKKIPWIKLRIVGDGEDKGKLERLVDNLSLQDTVFFTGRLPYGQMAELLCKCCVGLSMFKPTKVAAFASPLKLFDYMAAGIPIIATNIGDIGRIVRESESGLAISWDADEFVTAAENLLTKQVLWLGYHKRGLRYVQNYGWDNLFDGWLHEIQNRQRETTFSS